MFEVRFQIEFIIISCSYFFCMEGLAIVLHPISYTYNTASMSSRVHDTLFVFM